jgi:hypothetical protein
MPRFDGMGPMGQGPMTGRGRGYCAVRVSPPAPVVGAYRVLPGWYPPTPAGAQVVPASGFLRPFRPRFGRGFGMGRGRGVGAGRGRGMGRRW